MPEAKFVLKEPSATEKTLVYLFYNYSNQRLKYSTGERIHPKFWNKTKQRVKEVAQFPEYPEFNQRLKNIETAVNTCYRRLLNDGKVITPDVLRKELNVELDKERLTSKPIDLIEWMEVEIEVLKLNRKPRAIKVYEGLKNHLKNFSESRRCKLTFDSITIEFYEQFQDYLQNEKKLLNNTFGKQIKTLKALLNIATEKGINTNLAYKSKLFKVIQEEIDHIYLTEEELSALYEKDLSNKPYLDRVRDLFLIGCNTGLRFSDFTQLKKENLYVKNGKFEFHVITVKTNEKVVIPVKSVVKKIWDKYGGELPRGISNQKMNEYLKELGKLAEIDTITILKKKSGKEIRERICPKYELITTHTARRSFATNAYLSGVPAISIMKITGHRTESSFMKYLKLSPELNAQLLSNHAFFN